MKRIICALLIIALALFLVACGSREAITAEEFTTRMTEAGHIVEDISHVLDEKHDADVEAYLIADCGTFEVEFLVYETVERARQAFNQIRQLLEDTRGSVRSYTSVDVPAFSRFRQTSDGQLGVVSRIENTVVVVFTSADHRAEVDAVLDLLGY